MLPVLEAILSKVKLKQAPPEIISLNQKIRSYAS